MRLFVGLGLPPDIAFTLTLLQGGIRGARWEEADKLHLTLRYIGEVDGGTQRQVAEALNEVDAPAFSMTVAGVGHFPPRGKPRSVWAGIDDATPVRALHDQLERVLRDIGMDADPRNFAPHITLARLRNAPSAAVAEFLGRQALLRSPPFAVEQFGLYSSVLHPSGSKYRLEHTYRLRQD